MKKIVSALLIIATSIAIGGCAISNMEKSYDTVMVVTEVDAENNLITLATFSGYEYQFEGDVDYWVEGDVCTVEMLNNRTEHIADDKVNYVVYGGWVDYWGYDVENEEILYFFD